MKKRILLSIILSLLLTLLAFSSLFICASASELPLAYNNDVDNPMYVTSVKDQDEYGVCWAFSAISCCESDAIKNHGADKDSLDLSELHLAYFAYNAEKQDTGDQIIANMPFHSLGGDLSLPVFTLSNWIGLVDESGAKFSDFINDPSITLDPSITYGNVEYYLKNAYIFDYSTDKEKIKEAIMEFGAVQTAYFSDDGFLNDSTSAYYCPYANTINHAIAIIGWDDSYSKDNFNTGAKPQADGAWLVKNSWGTSKGENGYFWLSYEDCSIKSAIAYDVEPASSFPFDNNYQHDGGFSLIHYEYQKVNVGNVFTARGNEELSAISVFTHEGANADYTVRIYLNPETLSPTTFTNGTLVHEQTGILENVGFSTVELSSPIILNEGDVFIVCVETTAILGFDGYQAIKNESTIVVEAKTQTLPNQTYISVNGGGFYDGSSTKSSSIPINAKIKAYTKNLTLGTATLDTLPTMESIEYGQGLTDSALTGGRVIDSEHKKPISGDWSFKPCNSIITNGSDVEIVFTPDNPAYSPIYATIKASVLPSTPLIALSTDKSFYKIGDTLRVTPSLQNQYASQLNDFGVISYTYQVNGSEPIAFDGALLISKELADKSVTITATVSAVENKYLSASCDLSFLASTSGTTEQSTDVGGSSQDIIHTDKPSQGAPESNGSAGQNPSADDAPASESLGESEIESIEESVKESVKESVQQQIADSIVNTLSCGSSISVSALLITLSLSAIAITKKRRRK